MIHTFLMKSQDGSESRERNVYGSYSCLVILNVLLFFVYYFVWSSVLVNRISSKYGVLFSSTHFAA